MDGYGRQGHDFKSRASTNSATPALAATQSNPA